MATPTSNFVPVTFINVSASGEGRYLIDGYKWGSGGLGAGVTLTYSFPTGFAYFNTPYDEYSAWFETTSAERTAITQALAVWSSVANVDFVQVADNSVTVGEIRFALTGFGTDFAFAYLPFSTPEAGDVWFGEGQWNPGRGAIPKGDYDYVTILHEIGHALGLKHSFEFPNAIPDDFDNYFYTIMSYTASPWSVANDNYASFYPTTPMYYDLVAIQALYGRNAAHNSGNTSYVFNDGATYFQTIDDASGIDTIVFNGTQSCRIDLASGGYSNVSESIEFSDGVFSRSTVWIGPGTAIERATGGQGNDTLLGNGLGNILSGRGGGDTMRGLAGKDTLVGAGGADRMSGGGGADRFDFNALGDTGNSAAARDKISDFVHLTDKIDLSGIDASLGLGGNNAFVWRGVAAITAGAGGELRYSRQDLAGTADDRTIIYGDTDGDSGAEFQIELSGLVTLTAGDFVL